MADIAREPRRASGDSAVSVAGLTKTFRGNKPQEGRGWTDALAEAVKGVFKPPKCKSVVDHVDLEVKRGEFFGIIGSNGAGKTTLLKLLSCILYPDGGTGSVNGFDLRRERMDIRRSVVIAKAGGWMATLWQLTGRDNLLFRGRMSGLSAAEAARRADYVLGRLQIAHKGNEHSWSWSAGECQKFNLAMTFISRTPLVVLDEPTSHLDPQTSRLVREFAREDLNRHNGQTVVMSTHYLEEADFMCDRVAVMHEGRILDCDTPARLKARHVPDPILEVRVQNYTPGIGQRVMTALGLAELREHFADVATGQASLRPKWNGAPEDVARLRAALEAEAVAVIGVERVRPTLDDVYFRITPRKPE